jgi:hypothetical protein
MQTVKTLTQMASEFSITAKTLSNHIKKDETLKEEIKSGLQMPRHQKLIYDKFGYPPQVDKKDYENV